MPMRRVGGDQLMQVIQLYVMQDGSVDCRDQNIDSGSEREEVNVQAEQAVAFVRAALALPER